MMGNYKLTRYWEVSKVDEFKYVGSILQSDRKSYCEIEKIISNESKVIDVLNSFHGAKIL